MGELTASAKNIIIGLMIITGAMNTLGIKVIIQLIGIKTGK
jgi:hypothetical protein